MDEPDESYPSGTLTNTRKTKSSQIIVDDTKRRRLNTNEKLSVSPHSSPTNVQIDTANDGLQTMLESYSLLRAELDRKECVIKELLDKLHHALQNTQKQSVLIQELQSQVEQQNQTKLLSPTLVTKDSLLNSPITHISPPKTPIQSPSLHSTPASPLVEPYSQICPEIPNHEPIPSTPSSGVYLRVFQQPPSQVIYQRILRPFPGVCVVGQLEPSFSNYFIQVSLLKKSISFDGGDYQPVAWFKNGGSPLEGDKEKNLINGQAIFRKLKILTTTSQQGAVFVLKFTLNRYVNSQIEVVADVKPVVSNPIEVFSHTLYLKTNGKRTTSKPSKTKPLKSVSGESDSANLSHSPSSSPNHETEDEEETHLPTVQPVLVP